MYSFLWTAMCGEKFYIIRQLHASVDAEAEILKYILTSKKNDLRVHKRWCKVMVSGLKHGA
jgi:hypothetical protein